MTTPTYPPVDPEAAARVARLGALVDGIVTPALQPGMLVRLAREARGWHQQDLANEMRCSRSAVGKIETGRSHITPRRAVQLARILGLPAWAIWPDGPMHIDFDEEPDGESA